MWKLWTVPRFSHLLAFSTAILLCSPSIAQAACTPADGASDVTCIDDNVTFNNYETIPGSLDHTHFVFNGTTVTADNWQSMFGKKFTSSTGNDIHFTAKNSVFNGNGQFINVYQSNNSHYQFDHTALNFTSTSGFVFSFYAGPSANNTTIAFANSKLNLSGSTYGLVMLIGRDNAVHLVNTQVDLTGGIVGISLQGARGVVSLENSTLMGTRVSAIAGDTYGFKEFDINHSTIIGDNVAGAIAYTHLQNAVDLATDNVSNVVVSHSTIISNRGAAIHMAAPTNLIDAKGKSTHIYNVVIDKSTLTGATDTINDHNRANNLLGKQFNLTIQNGSVITTTLGGNAISLFLPAAVNIFDSSVIGNVKLQDSANLALSNSKLVGSLTIGTGAPTLGFTHVAIANSTLNGAIRLLNGHTNFTQTGGELIGSLTMGNGSNVASFSHANIAKVTKLDGGSGNATLNLENIAHTGGADMLNWTTLNLKNGSALTLNNNLVMGNAGVENGVSTGTGVINVMNSSALYISQINPVISALDGKRGVTVNNAGVIDLTHGSVGEAQGRHTLTIRGNYLGQKGNLIVNTVLDGSHSRSDKLVIDGSNGQAMAAGNTRITVNYVGSKGGISAGDGLPIVLAINNARTAPGAFTMTGILRSGAFDVRLLRGSLNPNDANAAQSWFLRSSYYSSNADAATLSDDASPQARELAPAALQAPAAPSSPEQSEAALPEAGYSPDSDDPPQTPTQPIVGPEISVYGSVLPTAANLNLATISNMHSRVGEEYNSLIHPSTWGRFVNGAWVRAFGESYNDNYSSIVTPSGSGSVLGGQIGLDVFRHAQPDGTRDYVGVYVSYGHARASIDGLVTNFTTTANVVEPTGTVNINGETGGIYWTHFWERGPYVDMLIQGAAYQGDATSPRASISLSGSGIAGSVEAGYPFYFYKRWLLEPEIQIIAQRVQMQPALDAYSDIALGSSNMTSGRLGARGQYSFETFGWLMQPYLLANLWSTFGGEGNTVYAGIDTIKTKAAPTWAQFGGGVTAQFNRLVSIYGQVDALASINHNHQKHSGFEAGLGVRINL